MTLYNDWHVARLTVVMSNNRPIMDRKVLDIDQYPDIHIPKLLGKLSHIVMGRSNDYWLIFRI